jgi:hypothetical protein
MSCLTRKKWDENIAATDTCQLPGRNFREYAGPKMPACLRLTLCYLWSFYRLLWSFRETEEPDLKDHRPLQGVFVTGCFPYLSLLRTKPTIYDNLMNTVTRRAGYHRQSLQIPRYERAYAT